MREKKAISWKEAREEAQKLRESATTSNSNDDDDDDAKTLGATNGIDPLAMKVDSVNVRYSLRYLTHRISDKILRYLTHQIRYLAIQHIFILLHNSSFMLMQINSS